MTATTKGTNEEQYYRLALFLGLLTVVYNLLEGLISIYFGSHDETLTLFGFGIDSFIEVLSGAGIIAMVLRIQRNPDSARSRFERTALHITGISFFILSAGLLTTAIYNLIVQHRPQTGLPGLVISSLSIGLMWALVAGKRRVGNYLHSDPILADANCSLVCIYMSLVLLASSLIFQLTGIGFVDSLGAAGLTFFSVREGREAFEKARELSGEAARVDPTLPKGKNR